MKGTKLIEFIEKETEYEKEIRKHNRIMRIKNTTANLKNPIFLAIRRQDWKTYLLNDIKPSEFDTELAKWYREDKEGADEFLNSLDVMSG